MDRAGGVPGGVVSEVRNLASQRIYIVSTAPEIGQDYWSTAILPVVERSSFFGLFKSTSVDVEHPIASIIRNSQEEAYEAHAMVRAIVSTQAEEEWLDLLPDAAPAEGYSEGARKKLRDILGNDGD